MEVVGVAQRNGVRAKTAVNLDDGFGVPPTCRVLLTAADLAKYNEAVGLMQLHSKPFFA